MVGKSDNLMNQPMLNVWRKFVVVLIVLGLIGATLVTPIHIEASSKVKKKTKLSYGVYYEKLNYSMKSSKGGVDKLEIDLSDQFTEVQLGKAEPLDKLATVRTRANSYHKKNNNVVGAINANFYLAQRGKDTRPVHLISEANRLVYAGYVNDDKNKFINEPIAFGIDKNGKGLIDHYKLNLTYTYNGKNYKISHTNRERATNNTILYTSDFYKKDTDTNQYGTEVVLKGKGKLELTLGSTLELKVTSIRKPGDTKPTKITEDSFVLSGHGTGSKRLEKVKVGDTIKINVGMDKKWQDSEFMVAGGPQLVKNGKVDISMNTNAAIARAKTSRTAVGVDKTNNKVFFVTVDTSISNGMSIPELARLMKELGADTALNLDGGGSTTMAIREKGSLKVVNKLQDGFERGVSGILMAADTEPKRIFKDVSYRNEFYESIQWAKDQGIFTGYGDNTFRPYENLSRMHGALIYTKALGLPLAKPKEVEKMFKDIPSSHLYAAQIATVNKAGIFTGGSDKRFRPDETLTREQMATTLVHAFRLKGNGKAKINLKNVSPTHRENVQILADNGLTNELKNFRPYEPITRAQFAALLYRISKME